MGHPLDHLLESAGFLDAEFARWQRDPASVNPEYATLFEQSESREQPSFLTEEGGLPEGLEHLDPGLQIYDLVHTYRQYGHLVADLDPLGRGPRSHPFLAHGELGFAEKDMDRTVHCAGFHGMSTGTVREFLEVLRETYCGPVGVEYMDIVNKDRRDWLQERMEPVRNRPQLEPAHRRRLLEQLVAADSFEETLQRMYPGSKRFSLEGGTTLITLLHEMAASCLEGGIEQMVLGMPHRGRLNVLAHFMQKPLADILAEFEGRPLAARIEGYGDVKYHLGYSSDMTDEWGRSLHLSLAFNPSHLEAIDPVVQGIVRAKQDHMADSARAKVIPVLLHGDAAFTGQGVVAETFNLSRLRSYTTGGTVHVIVNNQIGFTTDPEDGRSTPYASDLAKMIRAPVFHVNADHPEAVALIARTALGYRQTFHDDVVIDLICFRRHGHNELDDATFTQPLMVEAINDHEAVSRIYAGKLILGELATEAQINEIRGRVKQSLKDARDTAKEMPEQPTQSMGGLWQGIASSTEAPSEVNTATTPEVLERIAQGLLRVPDGFNWHPRLKKLMERRAAMILSDDEADHQVNWGCGEALALGSLLLDGTRVRFAGQDACRGTFSHRHAVYTDMETGQRFAPLDNLSPDQAPLEILNSPLSEAAVLGFEYGYSSADPWNLVVWEAQFGDFANGAQVVIDQLIASCEYKWGRMSGIVLLLPHGYEGQGPEHSSARLERFLELCAESNLQVANFTTPAQYFHALRRQMKRGFRKPLVVMSPKSLLRHPRAVSAPSELTGGRFHLAIDDEVGDREAVDRLLLCSGKIYYALTEAREQKDAKSCAIVRVEQLYPFPNAELTEILAGYPNLRHLVWVQEEPRNMGGWRNLRHLLERLTPDGVALEYAGRDSRAATATGSYEVHQREEKELVDRALTPGGRPLIIRRKQG